MFGEVLPSIRSTGAYSVQTAPATQDDEWLDRRMEGKELMKMKNASLQQLIASGIGRLGPKLYAIAANHINQAVLGFTETTTNFKKQQQLPRHVSIPDILNMSGPNGHGMGDLHTKMLTLAEAKKRKADVEPQSRKQQRLLLQTEQPRTVICAA